MSRHTWTKFLKVYLYTFDVALAFDRAGYCCLCPPVVVRGVVRGCQALVFPHRLAQKMRWECLRHACLATRYMPILRRFPRPSLRFYPVQRGDKSFPRLQRYFSLVVMSPHGLQLGRLKWVGTIVHHLHTSLLVGGRLECILTQSIVCWFNCGLGSFCHRRRRSQH